ncbi:hypothetical protein D9611_010898 [Ephemerocybe angulata]|uniref:Uncharacterized protein n=1 Tax=Ephemerocybe angulata TaxID=980116 RepID=A0A8H5FG06_9AGAR|nr:hypothetical protein D9611_010898 [Tulosesus angulatus]
MPKPAKIIVVYSGYKLPLDLFHQIMNEIPKYKEIREPVNFPNGRSLMIGSEPTSESNPGQSAYDPNPEGEGPVTHILFLLRYIKYKGEDQFFDPLHPDAPRFRVEKESDRQGLGGILKFFRDQGATCITREDFTFAYSLGSHPKHQLNGL